MDVQSSINTVDYTTNEDERQNCISDQIFCNEQDPNSTNEYHRKHKDNDPRCVELFIIRYVMKDLSAKQF